MYCIMQLPERNLRYTEICIDTCDPANLQIISKFRGLLLGRRFGIALIPPPLVDLPALKFPLPRF